MKWAVLAAGLLALAGPAMAQQTMTTTTTTTKRVTMTPNERVEIRRYVTEHHVRSVPPPPDFRVAPGARVPESVELYSFPSAAPYRRYRYTDIGGQTVVVDPATHEIIDVVR